MADYWVDTALGSGGDDGSSPTDAKRGTSAIKTGFEVDHDAGVTCWFRRTSAYDEGVVGLNADISLTADGTLSSSIKFASWPRASIPNTTITEGDWTNGSTTVDNIVGITCARGAHQARWATAPDGFKYLITRVIDSNTIVIDRPYAGSTVTGTDGKFQIEADDLYADRPQAGIDASWDADAHNVPVIDFNDEAYQILVTSDYFLEIHCFDFIDSADTAGIMSISHSTLIGCLFKQNSSDTPALRLGGTNCLVKRFTSEGSGAGSAQRGILSFGTWNAVIEDGAIYNMGDCGMLLTGGSTLRMNNMNVGVEIANGDVDISFGAMVIARDLKLGGTNGYVAVHGSGSSVSKMFAGVENYQKVLGAHKTWMQCGTFEKVAVTGTNANKKLSDDIIEITPEDNYIADIETNIPSIFKGEFELD
ncbi:MAG: hypothetical protein GY869_20990, partial [Planctomycetes bacterium]|nr:hypothetical protein [Planctomycetota bacterium]